MIASAAGATDVAARSGIDAMAQCALCHPAVVESYSKHGMSRSIGAAEDAPTGSVSNPANGHRYEYARDGEHALLLARFPGGGMRRQRLVGRIGAGIFATSWIGAEIDGARGLVTGRLFFAPLESITGRGLQLAPYEHYMPTGALGLPLTEGCLTCHSADRIETLTDAAIASGRSSPYPANHLGAAAFEQLSALTCGACHGDVGRHPQIFLGRLKAAEGDIGLPRLGTLPAARQRDICARCHLQGDVRIDLVGGRPSPDTALAGQIPVLVPARALDDFRFVGQLERLALSACFRGSPRMTCTTCHAPHAGVAAQGTDSFDAACARCHDPGADHTSLTVAEVSGGPPRSERGCVDCHVRRSQPFDLPHVRSADHFIRRTIPRPDDGLPHRQFADRQGELVLFDDGRLARVLASDGGRRWQAGVLAMALMSLGRFDEAAAEFQRFPVPGSAAARRPTAPSGLVPLETDPAFHIARGLILMGHGALEPARAAFSDALTLDPLAAEARLGRARLSLDTGDIHGALLDTQAIIEAYPQAETPWDLRLELAERYGRPDLARAALEASTRRWPSNAIAWHKLSILLRQQGEAERAGEALRQALALDPALERRPPQAQPQQ